MEEEAASPLEALPTGVLQSVIARLDGASISAVVRVSGGACTAREHTHSRAGRMRQLSPLSRPTRRAGPKTAPTNPQASKSVREAGDHPLVWREAAERAWPAETLRMPPYSSLKARTPRSAARARCVPGCVGV